MSDASAGRDMTTRVQVETSACRDMTGQPAQQSGYWEGGDADDRPQEGRRKFQQEKRGAAAYGRPCSSRVRLTGGVLAACGRRVGDVWAACGRRVGGVWVECGLWAASFTWRWRSATASCSVRTYAAPRHKRAMPSCVASALVWPGYRTCLATRAPLHAHILCVAAQRLWHCSPYGSATRCAHTRC
jgi:hypothetical protein